jgi:hypothetical protein
MRWLLVLVFLGCASSDPPPPRTAEKPAASGPACSNDCMARDSGCQQKCLDDDAPPQPEEGDSCGSKCNKALEACVARCK